MVYHYIIGYNWYIMVYHYHNMVYHSAYIPHFGLFQCFLHTAGQKSGRPAGECSNRAEEREDR